MKYTLKRKMLLKRKKYIWLSLMIIAVMIIMISCNKMNDELIISHSELKKYNRSFLELLSIDSARVIENPNSVFGTNESDRTMLKEEYTDSLKMTKNIVCVGKIKNITTVTYEMFDPTWYVSSGDTVTWHISTFDIEIDDFVKNIKNIEEIRVVSASRYFNGDFIETYNFGTYGDAYSDNTKGLFILKKITDENKWFIGVGEQQINLEDYADYYLDSYFQTDGNQFQYLDSYILVDEIRG